MKPAPAPFCLLLCVACESGRLSLIAEPPPNVDFWASLSGADSQYRSTSPLLPSDEPILASLPEQDRLDQLTRMADELEVVFHGLN